MAICWKMTRLAVLAAAPLVLLTPAVAEEAATPGATTAPTGTSDAKPSDSPPQIELTAEEKAEKDSRKACKADICAAFRGKQTAGSDISCNVVKSWRKEQLGKLVGKLKVSWPYGPVRCTSAVNLKRADIIKAMTEEKLEIQIDKHAVACVVEREKDTPTDIKFDFSPKVTFEKGKATKAKINWGKIEAPTLIKSALWTATAADNTVNMLSGTLVEDINDFIGKKCDEVKEQWAGK
ncbi:MAG: hypothetical protein ABL897_13775 [Hyphomicrobium sp.]